MRRADHMYREVVWMSVCFDCYVLSGRGLCDVLNPCTEEFYGCLSVLCRVCCHVEICSTGRSLVQSSRMDVCLL